jgi:micrococcal nuclease
VPPAPRRRLGMVVALVLGGMALALAAALVLSPALTGFVDGLRALGGAGADMPAGAPGQQADQVPADAQAAVVDRVVDGDTIRVTVEEAGGAIAPTDSVRVRLLNVDAPELDHPDRGEDCGATEATAFVEALLPPGSTVHLAADVEDRDVYDRPLRGVWNEHGVFVNAELVRAGWAEVLLISPNERFHAGLLPLEAEARAERRGAWSACDGFPP